MAGLLRRRSFAARAVDTGRTGQRYVVAMLDALHPKRLNDTDGPVTGERALSASAGLLAESFEDARVGRVGGEELGVVLPCVDTEGARKSCDAFRAELPQRLKAIGVPSVTVSVRLGSVERVEGPRDAPDSLLDDGV